MSTFGNNLIERLRPKLADVRPQNQVGEGSIAIAKNLSIGERENGQNGPSARRKEGAYLNRYVTDEQRSRWPIFIATIYLLFRGQDTRDDAQRPRQRGPPKVFSRRQNAHSSANLTRFGISSCVLIFSNESPCRDNCSQTK
jgi:hypothetical protein